MRRIDSLLLIFNKLKNNTKKADSYFEITVRLFNYCDSYNNFLAFLITLSTVKP